tara:strand:- start:15 stop:764 length:750 start_codon:yes stop_codon:yes gene_type:complete
MGKYFSTVVDCEIPTVAAGQHAAFTDGDVLFDWQPFDIPKGAARLLNVSMNVTSRGDAGATVNSPNIHIIFATKNDVSLGTVNSGSGTAPVPSIIGWADMGAAGYIADLDGRTFTTTFMTPTDNDPLNPNTVLQGIPTTGVNVGFDRLYVGAITKSAANFVSAIRINNGTLDGSEFTVDGTDPRLLLAVGDKINVCTTADTSVSKTLGTIKSMADANTITLETTTENAVTNDDFIYHRHPIRLHLSFEQ